MDAPKAGQRPPQGQEVTQVGPALLRYLDLIEKKGVSPKKPVTPETHALLAILDILWIENQKLKDRVYRLETKGIDE